MCIRDRTKDVGKQRQFVRRSLQVSEQGAAGNRYDDQADGRDELGRRHVFEPDMLAAEHRIEHREAENKGEQRSWPPEQQRQIDLLPEGQKLRGDDQHGD